jgi:exopolyphosphatase
LNDTLLDIFGKKRKSFQLWGNGLMVISLNSSLHILIAFLLSLLIVSTATFALANRCVLRCARAPLPQSHARACLNLFQGCPLHYSSSNFFIPQSLATALWSTTASEEMHRVVPSLQEFLQHRKIHPTSNIVIGNEAGDADSIISAICYSYVQECAFPNGGKLTPVVSISGKDFQSQRPETVRLLQLAGISPQECLCYIDDVSILQSDAETNILNITLVDHNRLTANRPYLNATDVTYTVVRILDHHLDEGYHTDTCAERNIAYENNMALVASTCTLIVEAMQNGLVTTPYPMSLSLLLLGVILLDSVNMDPRAGKVTERDVTAIQALVDHTDWQCGDLDSEARTLLGVSDTSSNCSPDLTAMFQTLQNAKFSPAFWNGLSARDALRLDYKQFTPSPPSREVKAVGVSTVLQSRSEFWKKDELLSSIRAYMKEVQIELFGIMFAYNSDSMNASESSGSGLIRELSLVGSDPLLLERLVEFLQSEGSLEIREINQTTPGMITEDKNEHLTIRSFQQMNTAASRKQIVPLLLKFFEEKMTP